MTPKEKAEELVLKFASQIDVFKINFNSKRSALIAVDEILNNVMMWWEMPVKDPYFITQKKYWTEVQQEIEKL